MNWQEANLDIGQLQFVGTPETDANADRLVEEGRAEAERLGKELQVLRVGWGS
jgi:hypothetical protein